MPRIDVRAEGCEVVEKRPLNFLPMETWRADVWDIVDRRGERMERGYEFAVAVQEVWVWGRSLSMKV